MNVAILLSLLSALSNQASAAQVKAVVTLNDHCFTVRTLVQGSGTAKTYNHTEDMGKVGECK
jgi:hypothetical protein